MDRTLPSVTFEHPSLRGDNNQVVVFQNLESGMAGVMAAEVHAIETAYNSYPGEYTPVV